MKVRSSLLFLILFALGCKEDSPVEPKQATITIQVENASCIEAWLRVTSVDPRTTVALLRDGQRISVIDMQTSDSLILDEGLFPKRTYVYQLQKLGSDSSVVETSASIQLTTMDTTTHNWSFSFDTVGVNLTILHDIAFINDTLSYAVGIINVLDSAGKLVNPPYNIAKWNGRHWELMRRLWDCRLYFPNCGPVHFVFNPIRSVAAFGPNDIWIAAGTAQHYDGIRWTEYPGIQGVGTAYKIWGTGPNNLWFVGYGGFIGRYTGTTWERVNSGVELTLNDVWGGSNRITGDNAVLIAASEKYTFSEKRVIRIRPPTMVDTLSWPRQDRPVQSLWFDSHSNLYACGAGVFVRKKTEWKEFTTLPAVYTNSIRGNAENDIWVVGDLGITAHFNGLSWHTYPELAFNGIFHAVAVKGNRMIAVGEITEGTGTRGIIVRGQRF